MLTKNNQLNQWLWKWHVVAGLITLPVMLLLATTGVIYLFKEDVNQQIYQSTLFTQAPSGQSTKLTYQQQLQAANQMSGNQVVALTLPTEPNQTTAFKIRGKGRASDTLHIDPYTGQQTGKIDQKQTFMYLIRKLHGELLLDTPGTLVIELVASWFIVLILTGLYVWWPKKGSDAAGFFSIRTNKGKRLFWRDLHAVSGFWLSALMLAVVAGGMPWTDVFGSNLKWVQAQTDSGYPKNWRHSKGLSSALSKTDAINIDQAVFLAKSYALPGVLTITLPDGVQGVYSIANRALWLDDQKVIHLDQYTGYVVRSYTWDDVGVLMNLRQIFMRFHQGEYGIVNWIVMLLVGLAFILMTSAGLTSYLLRKAKGSWSIPKVPTRFHVDKLLVSIIIVLGVIFPMFGCSLLLLWLWESRYLLSDKIVKTS